MSFSKKNKIKKKKGMVFIAPDPSTSVRMCENDRDSKARL